MSESEALKPCAFCTSSAAQITLTDRWLYRVRCPVCFAIGPQSEAREKAIAAWNVRPLPLPTAIGGVATGPRSLSSDDAVRPATELGEDAAREVLASIVEHDGFLERAQWLRKPGNGGSDIDLAIRAMLAFAQQAQLAPDHIADAGKLMGQAQLAQGRAVEDVEAFLRERIPSDAPFWSNDEAAKCDRGQMLH